MVPTSLQDTVSFKFGQNMYFYVYESPYCFFKFHLYLFKRTRRLKVTFILHWLETRLVWSSGVAHTCIILSGSGLSSSDVSVNEKHFLLLFIVQFRQIKIAENSTKSSSYIWFLKVKNKPLCIFVSNDLNVF